MVLYSKMPIWLKYLLKFVGIMSFDPALNYPAAVVKVSPLIFYGFYIYLINFSTTYFNDIVYEEITNILRYADTMGCIGCVIYMAMNSLVFYRRHDRIRRVVEKLTILGEPEPFKKWWNWKRYLVVITMGLNILFNWLDPVVIFWQYMLLYNIPPMVSSLDYLYQSEILENLRVKFNAINQRLAGKVQYQHSLDHGRRFSVQHVEALSILHHDLTMLSMEVNRIFGVTVLTSTVMNFCSMICTGYYLIYMVPRFDSANYLLLCTQILFMFMHNILIVLQVHEWNSTQETANRAMWHIQDIWDQQGKLNGQMRHLELISVRHLNVKLRFSAENFFPLDWTFIHTMLAAVTAYVVILIQFKI